MATFGYVFVVPQGTSDDVDEVGLCGAWCGEAPVGEKVTGGVNVVFDRVGADCDTRDGLSLDERDGVACEEVVLGGRGG